MRKFHIAGLLFVALLAADFAYAQSQPPVPSNGINEDQRPHQETIGDNQTTKQEQRGTEQSPFIIKILPADQTYKEPYNVGNKQQEKTASNWSLSDKITAVDAVGFFQFLALVATVLVMRGTAIRQLRSYIGITNVQHQIVDGKTARITIILKNMGQTPAYEVRGFLQPVYWKETGIDKLRNYSFPEHPPNAEGSGVLLPSEPIYHEFTISGEEYDGLVAAIKGDESFSIYGTYSYRDVFKWFFRQRRKTNFCWAIYKKPNEMPRWVMQAKHNDAT